MTTPNLQLIEPPDSDTGGQGGSGEAFRESFRVLDSLSTGWMAVLSQAAAVPPAAPIQGATYLVPEGATGVWADHVRHLAIFTPAGWVFRPPRKGWIVVALNENMPYGKVYQYNSTEWVAWQIPGAQVSIASGGNVETAIASAQDANESALAAIAAQGVTLEDHEDRIVALEAGSGGGSGGGGGIGIPGTIDDLVLWLQAETIKFSAGEFASVIQNQCASQLYNSPVGLANGATISATQLNGLNVLLFPTSSVGRYTLPKSLALGRITLFVVTNPASFANPGILINGPTNSLQVGLDTGKLTLVKTFVAALANATTAFTTGTWEQQNVTYDPTTGAYAFRRSGAANGSGTSATTITANVTSVGYNAASNSQDLTGSLAELIVFQRVLSAPEIASVEAYLLAKWGV